MKQISCILAAAALCLAPQAFASTCGTNKLCVPGDFSSPDGTDFSMDLLSGKIYFDISGSSGGQAIGDATFNNLQPIYFHASPFADPIGSSVGTSTLSYSNINHYSLGSFLFFGVTAEFYLQGTGFGTLVDIDGTKGDWSLNVPLFATWNGVQFNFGNVQFSTANSFNFYAFNPVSYTFNNLTSLSGQSMDYATGNAFLVAQTTITDPSNPFNGVRITLGLNGNDPVVSVPEASVVWQLLAGLGLLGIFTQIRNRSLRRDLMPKMTA